MTNWGSSFSSKLENAVAPIGKSSVDKRNWRREKNLSELGDKKGGKRQNRANTMVGVEKGQRYWEGVTHQYTRNWIGENVHWLEKKGLHRNPNIQVTGRA